MTPVKPLACGRHVKFTPWRTNSHPCLSHSQIPQRDTLYPRALASHIILIKRESQVHTACMCVLLCSLSVLFWKFSNTTYSANIYLPSAQCPRPQDKKGYWRYRVLLSLLFAIWLEEIWPACPPGVETIFEEPIAMRCKGLFGGPLDHGIAAWFCWIFPLSIWIIMPKKLLLI